MIVRMSADEEPNYLEVRANNKQCIVLDPEKDKAGVIEVAKAAQRVNNPTLDEQQSHLTKPEVLMRYLTQEHVVYPECHRPFQINADGTVVQNHTYNEPEFVNYALTLRETVYARGQTHLGVVCSVGELCFGQAVFASVVMDKLGIPNTVLHVENPRGNHALIQFFDDKDNKVKFFDSMSGRITEQPSLGTVFVRILKDVGQTVNF